MSTTTMSPAQTVRTHPAVHRAHEELHRALEGASDPQVRTVLERIADALRTDPTLALDREYQRTLDLIMELRRQLGSLTRKAARAAERAALLADPDLDQAERAARINQLGRVHPGVIEEEAEVRERLEHKADELAGRARPDWDAPERLAALARTLLPCGEDVQREAARLRSRMRAAAALAPDDPQVRQLLDLAEQMHVVGQGLR
ncbi:hypothetical protein ABZ635_22690 [Nocardiopsis sp. NPDC007018]|uniref:hypothetical protein n=1 Tax=Nocardiopsis sp. NPDC007018 TaxID=3155721 RepID=UPI0033E21D0D